jgi:hypothetical protein
MKGDDMKRIYLAIAALFAFTSCDCGGRPYKGIAYGYKAVNYSARLTESFDGALDLWAKAKDAECSAKHQAKTVEYAKCVNPALKFLRTWHGKVLGKPTGKGILPAIQSAQKTTRLELDAAYDYIKANETACINGDAKCDAKIEAWKAALKPGLCGLKEAVDRAIKIGAYKISQDATYKMVMGLAYLMCGGAK